MVEIVATRFIDVSPGVKYCQRGHPRGTHLEDTQGRGMRAGDSAPQGSGANGRAAIPTSRRVHRTTTALTRRSEAQGQNRPMVWPRDKWIRQMG